MITNGNTSPTRTFPWRSSNIRTYHLSAVVRSDSYKSVDLLQALVADTKLWIADGGKFPRTLPANLLDDQVYTDDYGAYLLSLCCMDRGTSWGLRLREPDKPFPGRMAVAGRTWTTEITLKIVEDGVAATVDIFCTSETFAQADVAYTCPKLVRTIARKYQLWTDGVYWQGPVLVHDRESLQALYAKLQDTGREQAIILLTECGSHENQVPLPPYVVAERPLSERLIGSAHVYLMPRALSFDWSELVGKQWSAYGGAVRTYQPDLDFASDSPYRHKLALLDQILFWKEHEDEGVKAFQSFLVNQCTRNRAARVRLSNSNSFATLRTVASERQLSLATSDTDRVSKALSEIRELKNQVSEANSQMDWYAEQCQTAENEAKEAEEETKRLAQKVRSLETALHTNPITSSLPQEVPQSYEGIAIWCDNELAGNLRLLGRAKDGLKRATYEDIPLVISSLQLLAHEFVNWKLGWPDGKRQFDDRLAELQLKLDRSISDTRAGEEGMTYDVKYPPGSNQKRRLEWHLTKGASRDPRYCFRCYFFWDEESSMVVVGWLPSHLDTRST